jgi:hypothetical protein
VATLVYQGGPMGGSEHKVPGASPPAVRYYASPGDRAQSGSWIDLHRYVARQAIAIGKYVYEYTGVYAVRGPVPAVGPHGAEPIEGWS